MNLSETITTTTLSSQTSSANAAATAFTSTPAVSPGTCDLLSDLQCATRRLWQVVTPVIVVMGLTGNLLVIIIFSKLRFGRSSTLVHLFVLALTDSLIMCLGPTRYWILSVFQYDVRLVSSAGCKLHLFLLYVSLDFSGWVLVSVTVERTLCVLKPLHVRAWFTVRRASLRLSAILLVLCVVNGHYFFSNAIVAKTEDIGSSSNHSSSSSSIPCRNYSTFFLQSSVTLYGPVSTISSTVSTSINSASENSSLQNNLNKTVCSNSTAADSESGKDTQFLRTTYDCDSISPEWENFEELTFVYIDLCFDSVCPFFTMVVCNSLIIAALRKHAKNRPRYSTRRQMLAMQASGPDSDPLSFESSADQQEQTDLSPSSHAADSGRQGNLPPALSLLRRNNKHLNSGYVRSRLPGRLANGPSFDDCTHVSSNRSREYEGEFTHNSQRELRDSAAITLQETSLSKQEVNPKGISQMKYSKVRSRYERNLRSEEHDSSGCSGVGTEGKAASPDPPLEYLGTNGETASSVEYLITSSSTPEHAVSSKRCSYSKRPTAERRTFSALPDSSKGNPDNVKEPVSPLPSSENSIRSRDSLVSPGVTRMLVLVTTVFLVTTLPSALYYIIDSYLRDQENDDAHTNQVLDLMQALTNLLQYANYGSNFLLYSSRSKRFRLEVKYLLGIKDSRFRRHFHSSVLSGGTSRHKQRECNSVISRTRRMSRNTPISTSTTTTTITTTTPSTIIIPTITTSTTTTTTTTATTKASQDDHRLSPLFSSNCHMTRAPSDADTDTLTESGRDKLNDASMDNRSLEKAEIGQSYKSGGENPSFAFELGDERYTTGTYILPSFASGPEVSPIPSMEGHSVVSEPEEEAHITSVEGHSVVSEPEEEAHITSMEGHSVVSEPEEEVHITSMEEHSFASGPEEVHITSMEGHSFVSEQEEVAHVTS